MATISSVVLPTPGVITVIPDDSPQALLLSREDTSKTRLTTGQVIAIGGSLMTEFGQYTTCPVTVGDLIVFLTYDSGLDKIIIDGQTYHLVMFKDIRGVI